MREAVGAVGLLAAVWVVFLAAMPTGLFLVDEAIYLAAVDGFLRSGGLAVDNGYALFGSDDLRLRYMHPGPEGLAPQYPSGYTLLAAPAYALGSLRGIMALNLAAALAVVALSMALARRFFEDRRVVLGTGLVLMAASFLPDYAVAIWPHAVSLAAAMAALLLGVDAVEGRRPLVGAGAASGLIIGLGMTLRLDVVLVLPALAAYGLIYAERPVRLGVAMAAGLVPGLLLATALNGLKFGQAVPITYGAPVGAADATRYLGLGAVLILGCFAALALRFVPALAPRRWWIWPGLAAAVAALALVPGLREMGLRWASNAWVLLADLRGHPKVDVVPGHIRTEAGYTLFFGVFKAALGQSLPWIGALTALAAFSWDRQAHRAMVLTALVSVATLLPFLPNAWHGGFGHSLRYLLYLVPAVSMLAAALFVRLIDLAGAPGRAEALLLPVALAAGIVGLLAMDPAFGAHLTRHLLPIALLAVLAAAGLALTVQPGAGRLLRAGMIAGFAYSAVVVYAHDVPASMRQRQRAADSARAYAAVPDRSLVLGFGAVAQADLLRRPSVIVAVPDRNIGLAVPDLADRALAEGLRVFSQAPWMTEASLAATPGLVAQPIETDPPRYLVEITRAGP